MKRLLLASIMLLCIAPVQGVRTAYGIRVSHVAWEDTGDLNEFLDHEVRPSYTYIEIPLTIELLNRFDTEHVLDFPDTCTYQPLLDLFLPDGNVYSFNENDIVCGQAVTSVELAPGISTVNMTTGLFLPGIQETVPFGTYNINFHNQDEVDSLTAYECSIELNAEGLTIDYGQSFYGFETIYGDNTPFVLPFHFSFIPVVLIPTLGKMRKQDKSALLSQLPIFKK